MIGNGDAHIKNWSLLYPDRLHPVLSPAYDLLSTIQYLPNDDLGLNLARSKRFEDVRMESFERLARKADLDLNMRATVSRTVKRVRDAWGAFERDMPVAPEVRRTIEAHWKGIPIL
jgi:serine/threonine-protein kinase HipA